MMTYFHEELVLSEMVGAILTSGMAVFLAVIVVVFAFKP